MENLKALFAIFFLLILASITIGCGVDLLSEKQYGNYATGALLILSSLSVLAIFIHEFFFAGSDK